MTDPTKAEVAAALLRVIGAKTRTLPLTGATAADAKHALGGEPEKRETDNADHERARVEHLVKALRCRADQAEAEGTEAYLADRPHREADLRGEATRLRAIADRHEASLRVRARATGKP